MHIIIWSYTINPEYRSQFLDYYSSTGKWAELFAKSNKYYGTDFFNGKNPDEYLTIDKWESEEFFIEFKKNYKEEYDVMDNHCEDFTIEERYLGSFNS